MIEKERLISEVTALKNGAEASDSFLEEVRDDLYYYILKTVNDPPLAEDLTQDTLVEILMKIDTLQEPAAFITWSKKIAYHKCTDYFKVRHDVLLDEFGEGNSIFDTLTEERGEFLPGEALEQEDLKKAIHAMIMDLPEEQRSAILLRYFDELPVKDIADIHGVSEGTVKSRLNYGRKAIKQAVESYEKKNGIKLHCVGIVPLLLWLFRQYRLSRDVSLTAANASSLFFEEAAREGAVAVAAAAGTTAAAAGTTAAVAGTTATAAAAGVAGALGLKWLVGIIIGIIIIGIGILLPVIGGDDPTPPETGTPVIQPTEQTGEKTDPVETTQPKETEDTEPSEDETPEMPADPTDPSEDETPEIPVDPTDPSEDETPEMPVDPTDPSEPGEDETPEMPADPTQPEDPTVPEEPTDPVEPTQPEEPTEPEQPTQPEEPTEPGEDETPEMPLDPTEPGETPEMPI